MPLCDYEIKVLNAIARNELHSIPYGAARNQAIEVLRNGYLKPEILEPTDKATPYIGT